jgi:hypothetical protein
MTEILGHNTVLLLTNGSQSPSISHWRSTQRITRLSIKSLCYPLLLYALFPRSQSPLDYTSNLNIVASSLLHLTYITSRTLYSIWYPGGSGLTNNPDIARIVERLNMPAWTVHMMIDRDGNCKVPNFYKFSEEQLAALNETAKRSAGGANSRDTQNKELFITKGCTYTSIAKEEHLDQG